MKKLLACALIVFFSFASCNKDDKCNTDVASISGSYKLTGLTYKASATATEQDLLPFLDPCERDDIEIFASNGTYTYQDAGTVCVPNGSFTGTWSLSGSTITVDGDAGTIQSWDCHTLVVYAVNVNTAGDRMTFTYTRQ